MAWLIARAVQQRGCLRRLEPVLPPPGSDAPRVTVIIPARDEEANIGHCLESLLAQDYPAGRVNIIVVDDQSADATAAIVRGLARQHPQITLINSPPLPPRWTGKSHACWIGARAAAPPSEWLCFIDADVTAQRGALSSAVHTVLRAAPRSALADAAPGAGKLRRAAYSAVRADCLVVRSGSAAVAGALRQRGCGDRAIHAGPPRCLRSGGRACRGVHGDL